MLKGYERLPGEHIDSFLERVNAGVEELRDASLEVQGPNLNVAADGGLIAALQIGKVEALRTVNGPVPSFRPYTRAEVEKRLSDKREGKGAFRIPGN